MTPQSFNAYLAEHNHASVRLGCILCALLFPAGVALDLLTHPEHTVEFLALRLLASALSFVILGISRLKGMERYSYHLTVALALSCACVLEVMILKLEGARSPYYAGLNLLTLGVGLICFWTIRQTLLAVLLILGVWLVPALYERSSLEGEFYNNLYFLLLTGIMSVAANAARYNLARREWEARTALAQTSAELATALERSRDLDRLKSQFFANISHELRTPLTLITAPLQELLDRRELPETMRGTLQVILRNALRLHRLIDGLFDLALLEAGRMRLRISPLDLKTLVQGVVAAFQPAADAMGLKLVLSISLQGDGVVLGDADKLEVVLTNLLGNAVKFTEREGTVMVRLEDGPAGISLIVADDGPGIPEAEQPHIFERFRRVESPGRKQGGAGIGLALVKELVELHGGTVQVRSRPGEGACFTVCLPAHAAAAAASEGAGLPHELPQAAEPRARISSSPALLHINATLDSVRLPVVKRAEPRRPVSGSLPLEIAPLGGAKSHILVAEDNADMRRFLKDLLSPTYRLEFAADGREALQAIEQKPPDLLLADVMMPHLSGTELCHKVKADPRTRAMPVILLTARGGIDETLEGFAHGADDYLVKPFNPRELLMRVAVQLKLRRLTAQVSASARLAAVGTLAAGVAHEIKNPLNAVSTGLSALRRRPDAPAVFRGEVLEMMEECVTRIADIATALTDHARPADGEGVSLCDLRLGLESTLRLLGERLRQADVKVVRDYRTSRRIPGRPRQLNQVFLNLLDNALRASQKGGRIFVTMEEVREEGGERVLVRVRDEGAGIPAKDQERIFDPFYTTRPPGEGTGLGLYLSRQIVEGHGGTLRVQSEPGQGTELLVDLPAQAVLMTEAESHGAAA